MTEPAPEKPPSRRREPTLVESFVPLVAIALFLGVGFKVFGLRVELCLLAAAIVTGLMGLRLGMSWQEMQDGIVENIGKAMPALLIIILVGALIASWLICGTIPMIVDYGLKIISPKWFLFTACIVCSIVSVVTGTSWGTVGTVGIALIGIGTGMGVPPGPTAGAIVSGAYFGDKLSPFSDTTNLAPIAARSNLYDHIAHMLWTTAPAWLVALTVYVIVGRGQGEMTESAIVTELSAAIRDVFRLNLWLWLPPAITLSAALLKKPIIPGMVLSIVAAVGLAIFVQDIDDRILGTQPVGVDLPGPVRIANTLVLGPSPATGNDHLDTILNRGGLLSMLDTMLIAICAFCFAGIARGAGMLDVLLKAITRVARTTGTLIASAVGSSVLVACMTGNSYLSILIPGELFRTAFKERGLAAKNLSRICEDAGTVVVPIIPWSIAAVFINSNLNVDAIEYGKWAVFCYSGIFFSLLYGFTGFKIAPRIREDETQPGS